MLSIYLHFNGNCEEAVRYYEKALGASNVQIFYFKGSPMEKDVSAAMLNKVMHASFHLDGQTVMCDDGGMMQGEYKGFHGTSLILTLPSVEATQKIYNRLIADGGKPLMPLSETFWSMQFGMCLDRFGVTWMTTGPEKPMPKG